MGKKIEAFLKENLYIVMSLVALLVYGLLKLMGMREFMISLDDIVHLFAIVMAFVIANKIIHNRWVIRLVRKSLKLIGLHKVFKFLANENLEYMLFGIQHHMNKVDDKAYAEEKWQNKLIKNVQKIYAQQQNTYRVFDSFELASLVVLAQAHGFETDREFATLYEYVKPMLIQPFYCTMDLVDDGKKVSYIMSERSNMAPVNCEANMSLFAQEAINIMKANVSFPVASCEMEELAEGFRDLYKNFSL